MTDQDDIARQAARENTKPAENQHKQPAQQKESNALDGGVAVSSDFKIKVVLATSHCHAVT